MTEQLGLDVKPSLQERYQAWRATPGGCWAFAEVERRALAIANGGACRVEVNLIVAEIRRAHEVRINNSYRSFLARELITRHPLELKAKIEVRPLHPRKAA